MPTDVSVFTTPQLTAMLNGFWSVLTSNLGPILVVMGVMFGLNFVFRKLGAAKNARV